MHDQWKDTDASGVGGPTGLEVASYPRAFASWMDATRSLHAPQRVGLEKPESSSEDAARFGAILADPPWRFQNATGKVAPAHRRLKRYDTLSVAEIAALPVADIAADTAHLYLWSPNAMLAEALAVMAAWGFTYKTVLVWHKVRKDGGSDGRGVGFYFRNVTEMVLFGVRGKHARTLARGRRQVNLMASRKREHSRKPDELYDIIEACSPGPWIELFARGRRKKWEAWGEEANG